MRQTRPSRLFGAVSAIALVVALGGAAYAGLRPSDVHQCTNQSADHPNNRIAACSAMITSGRLHGELEGVAYSLRGLAYLDRGDIAHAIADFDRAIELAPDFAPAWQNRGNAWYARGNYGRAIADYDANISLDPNSPSPYVNRATVRRDLGFYDGALADYQQAISLDAVRASAYSGRGQLYLRQQDWPRALADFEQAVRLEPNADNYALRAQAYEGTGDLIRAKADYQAAARARTKTNDVARPAPVASRHAPQPSHHNVVALQRKDKANAFRPVKPHGEAHLRIERRRPAEKLAPPRETIHSDEPRFARAGSAEVRSATLFDGLFNR